MKDDELRDLPEAERALAHQLRAALRASEQQVVIPASLRHETRRRAIEAISGPGPAPAPWAWAAGGAAVLALLALLLNFRGLAPVPPELGLEVLDMLADEADPELYEDLELYRWLAEAPRREGNDV